MTDFKCIAACLIGLIFGITVEAKEDVVQKVKPIVRVAPVLPKGMTAENMQQGYVTVKFEINEQGSVENPEIIDANPAKIYDRVSIAAILKFKFAPQLVNGQPVRITATQTFEFEGKQDRKYDSGFDLTQYEPEQLSFTLQRYKENLDYKSTLVVTDLTNNLLIRKDFMPDSEVDWPFLASDSGSPYLFFYHSLSRKKAQIKVYKRADFSLVRDIDIPPLSQGKTGQGYQVLYKHLNDRQLITVVGKKKPKLVVIDAESGVIEEKHDFERNSLVEISEDKKYVWGRKVSNVPRVWVKSELQILKTDDFALIKKIPIQTHLKTIIYLEGILELNFYYESKEKYRRMFLRLSDQEYIGDFKTARKSNFISSLGPNKSRILYGQDDSGEYLKVAKLEQGEFSEITNKEIKIRFNEGRYIENGEDSVLTFYGKEKFVMLPVFNPTARLEVDVPFSQASGFYIDNNSKVILTEKNGADLALVDLNTGELVATEKSKLGSLKMGQYPEILKTLSIKVPAGYRSFAAKDGFKTTDNLIFANNDDSRLFVLRIQSSNLTSFKAEDLSDKRSVDTGRQTFQLVQRTGDPKSPIMAIGVKQITFIDPQDGSLISQFKYDSPGGISTMGELVYWKDGIQKSVSLDELINGGS